MASIFTAPSTSELLVRIPTTQSYSEMK